MKHDDKDKSCPQWFQESRHVEPIKASVEEHVDRHIWTTYVKERMKTVSVALVLCLNIGVDPPDAEKPNPCAHVEGWVDLRKFGPQKAMQHIAHNLQKNYERWQPRARYKVACDPTVTEVQKLCSSLRRNAKEERVLFHYNGHGVPKPTLNGEIWVFNKNITQYIPLSIFDLQTWMSFPSVYVWDCNGAEIAIKSFRRFADDQVSKWTTDFDEFKESHMVPPLPSYDIDAPLEVQAAKFGFKPRPLFEECIQLGACREDENLPQNPELPADLFTACLTTPIQISLHWYIVKNRLKDRYPLELASEIPGTITDRKTPLGELNWIFTAITDTIAWHALPKDVFQRLFRQDLLIASLFRSFLLADRIMCDNGCHVVSKPVLPSVYDHPLWEAWDYTVDLFLNHLVHLRRKHDEERADIQGLTSFKKLYSFPTDSVYSTFTISSLRYSVMIDIPKEIANYDHVHSSFFIEQLQAFDVWLRYGVSELNPQPPQQLPVVLQVLLSQAHRVKALELLARFLDLGSWAVGYALSVGIFPYVLKLLQCGTLTLRPWLAFIWAKILAVESDCKNELMKDNGYMYFIQILNDPLMPSRFKIVPAFVTATLIHNNRQAQEKLTKNHYVTLCTELLSESGTSKCRMLRLWILVGLGRLWVEYNDARWHAVRSVAYERVMEFLDDPVPEVRAAAVFSLGCLVRNRSQNNEHATTIDHEVCDKLATKCTWDGSVLVRSELVVAVQWFIVDFESRFVVVALDLDKKSQSFCEEDSSIEKGLEAIDESFQNNAMNGSPMVRSSSVRHPSKTPVKRSSSLAFNKNYRRTISHDESSPFPFNTAKSSRRKASLLDPECGQCDEFMRQAILGQLIVLESKTFHEPFERIWMSLLRLALDPVLAVATKAQTLIKHIVKLAIAKRETRERNINRTMQKQIATDSEAQTPPPQFMNNRSNHPMIAAAARASVIATTPSKPAKAPVKFMVGSPTSSSFGTSVETTDRAYMIVPTALPQNLANQKNASVPTESQMEKFNNGLGNNNTSTPRPQAKTASSRQLRVINDDAEEALNLSLSAAKFTPKRNVYNRGIRDSNTNLANLEVREGAVTEVVSTEFVPWCSKFFTQSILDKIYQGMCTSSPSSVSCETMATPGQSSNSICGNGDSARIGNLSIEEDASADMSQFNAQPTDWAYYVSEGLGQRAAVDRESLQKNLEERCDTPYMSERLERPYVCLEYSLLRTHLFGCDGQYVHIWNWDTEKGCKRVRSFDITEGNAFVKESVSDLLSLNGLTHELIMAGSSNGLIRIWDPNFDPTCSPTSLECYQAPEQVTATYLVNDLVRIPGHGLQKNLTLYDWNQDCGRLVCAGNLRVCRIWDCHSERTQTDISIDARNGPVTGLSTHLTSNTIACGFRNGTVNLYDDRLPSAQKCAMVLRDLQSTVVGCKIADENEGIIVAGAADGTVCIWDPRKYQDPLYQFSIVNAQSRENYDITRMTKMDVQVTGQLIACGTTQSTAKIFNLTKRRCQSVLKIPRVDAKSEIVCMKYHPLRVFLATATSDGMLTAYGMPKDV